MATSVIALRNSSEFKNVATKGRKWVAPAFVFQVWRREGAVADSVDPRVLRIGFTVSRRQGNAVARNRIRRRLRLILEDLVEE